MSPNSNRKIVLTSMLLPPVFYILITLILMNYTEVDSAALQIPFVILVCCAFVNEFISILYLYSRWNISEEDIAVQLQKEIIRLAVYHLISIVALIYFFVIYAGA